MLAASKETASNKVKTLNLKQGHQFASRGRLCVVSLYSEIASQASEMLRLMYDQLL
jgi:hypothetical protein